MFVVSILTISVFERTTMLIRILNKKKEGDEE
jgi:hypothetical protein